MKRNVESADAIPVTALYLIYLGKKLLEAAEVLGIRGKHYAALSAKLGFEQKDDIPTS